MENRKLSAAFNVLSGKKGLAAATSGVLAVAAGGATIFFAAVSAAPLVIAAAALSTASLAMNIQNCVRHHDAQTLKNP